MRRRARRHRGLAGLALLAVLAVGAGACAPFGRRPTTPPPSPPIAAPAPEPAPEPTVPPERPPTLPPVVIRPRAEAPPETARPEERPAPAVRPAPPIAPVVPPQQRGTYVVLNFDNADIETVVHAASEILGFNYVLAPDVRGKVTVQTSGRIGKEDVFGVLLAVLEVHGFTAVRSGSLYKIVRIEGARERAVPTIVGAEPDPTRTADEVITQIVPIRFTSVTDLGSLLRSLISSRGSLIAHRETNILIVTDTASNLRRLLDIIRTVDVEVALDELQIVPIRFADAADLATILNQLFASGRLRRALPGAAAGEAAPTPAPAPPAAPPVPAVPRPLGTPVTPTGETVGTERQPLIIAERRSNSLIIYARRHELEVIRRLVGQLDIDIYGGRQVFIYYLENAKAKDLAATLNEIYGAREAGPGAPAAPRRPAEPPRAGTPDGAAATPPAVRPTAGGASETGLVEGEVRFIPDETTNAIIVTTFPRNWQEIEETIKKLDRMPRQVLIEVLVAEITLTDDLRLGVDWALRSGSFRFAQQSISTASPPTITSPSTVLPPAAALALPGAGLTAFAFETDKFFSLINTLASENRLNVLSSPHVLTSENKKAVINVSDSIPIVTSQQVPIGAGVASETTPTTAVVGTQTIEFRDAGVILTVTPRIGERGTVALDVKQEVNAVGAPEPPTGTRRIIKREAETSVVLVNNRTLVLGGLIRDSLTVEHRGIPFLKDIPILGYLFGARVRTVEKTELLILITPRVIGTALDAARVTEEMQRLTPQIEEAIRRAPRPPTMAPSPAPEPAPRPPSSP